MDFADTTTPTNDSATYYIKQYPDRLVLIKFKTQYSQLVTNNVLKKTGKPLLKCEDAKFDSQAQSLQRAKTKLADLTICNNFEWLITFTFNCIACRPKCNNKPCTCNKKTCKRFDLDYVIRTLKFWNNYQIKKYGKFPYILVMERHEDSAYHFHGLFKDYLGKKRFWKYDIDGRPLYNLVSYRKGWSSAKEVYNISGASSYVRKYISKDMPMLPGKKRYWASQGLKRPIIDQDPALMEAILQNPESTTWKPNNDVTLRDSGTVKFNTTNLHSITTLMLDNKASYEAQLEALESNDV